MGPVHPSKVAEWQSRRVAVTVALEFWPLENNGYSRQGFVKGWLVLNRGKKNGKRERKKTSIN